MVRNPVLQADDMAPEHSIPADSARFAAPASSGPNGSGQEIQYRDVFEQWAGRDHRGVLQVGTGRRVIAMNAAARSLLDYSGKLPARLGDLVHDEHVGFAVGDAFHDRRDVRHETYLPDPDRLLSFHVVPILSASGEPTCVIVSVEDITQLRHLETVRKDFVANVSHELRTPIASINLLVETLQGGALEDRAATEHFLHRIEVETLAMARLVEELLELSRLESGALALRIGAVDVAGLIDGVANRLIPAAEDKEINLVVDVQADLGCIAGDDERLEQVLMNLVHNAIKFTPRGGTVTIRAVRQGLSVQLDVIDTGAGIDPRQAERIFERFYKVDGGRSRDGSTGLGLAIAQHILQLHGSRLTVVSEPGRGSRFGFALPLKNDD